jgi:hypothetical protein
MARDALLAVCALSLVLLCFAPHALAKEEEGVDNIDRCALPSCCSVLHSALNALLVSAVILFLDGVLILRRFHYHLCARKGIRAILALQQGLIVRKISTTRGVRGVFHVMFPIP